MNYLITEWQPIAGIFLGLLMLTFYYYLQISKKAQIVTWIAKNIFRNQFMAEKSAESALNVVTSFLFMIGGIWIVVAIYYLSNS